MKQKFTQLKAYFKRKNKLILQDPNTFEEKFALSINNRIFFLVGTTIILVFGFILFIIISYTSLKEFIPGFPKNASGLYEIDKNNQSKLVELESKNKNRELWITNLQNILNKNDSVSLKDIKDTLTKDTNFNYKKIIFERIKEDSMLRKKVEDYSITNKNSIVRSILLSVLNFEIPHQGVIISRKSGKLNEATFENKKKSKIRCSMTGTVIAKSETNLILQHQNNIVSVYQNFTAISPSLGEKVNRGSKIGMTKDSTFTFQLWYNGESVPVEIYEAI